MAKLLAKFITNSRIMIVTVGEKKKISISDLPLEKKVGCGSTLAIFVALSQESSFASFAFRVKLRQ